MSIDSTQSRLLQKQRHELRAIQMSLLIGIVLLVIKFTAYFLTKSSAIFADAMENIVNVLASSFALYAIVLAHRPADKEHPYGHGKIEFFSAGLEGGMIILAAILILGKVVVTIFNHEPATETRLDTGLVLIAIAMLVNGVLGLILLRLGRKRGSLTLEADGQHLLSDAITSVVVLIALGGVRLLGVPWIDPLAAVLVAIYITWMGLRLVKRSAAGLMDEQDPDDQSLIRKILDGHLGPSGKEPHICSYHKLRLRHNGRYHWVDFHIMVPAHWSIDKGHQAASSIEYEIELALGEGNATAHVEPCVTQSCANCTQVKAG